MNRDEIENLAAEIIDSNYGILCEFFAGIASGEYYDGTCWQLYVDTDDNSLRIHREASCNSWLQRADGSLIMLVQVSGYDSRPEDEIYSAEDDDDLSDFGLNDWLDYNITPRLIDVLSGN